MTNQLDLFAAPADTELDEAIRTVAMGYLGDTGLKHFTSYQAASTLGKLHSLPQPFHRGKLEHWDRDGIKDLQKHGLASVSYLKGKMMRAHFKRARLLDLAQEYDRLTVAWCS